MDRSYGRLRLAVNMRMLSAGILRGNMFIEKMLPTDKLSEAERAYYR
jgi:hypothetical protein